MSWQSKELKTKGYTAVPQRYNPTTDEWEVETTEADPVYDADVLAKIQELDEKVQGIIDGTTPANTQLTGSNTQEGIAELSLNTEGVLFASATRSSTATSPNQTNKNHKGILISLNVTAISGTGGLIPILFLVDPVTGGIRSINPQVTSITTTGNHLFMYYPGINSSDVGSSVKQASSLLLPKTFGFQVYHNDSSSYTYSVGYSLIM